MQSSTLQSCRSQSYKSRTIAPEYHSPILVLVVLRCKLAFSDAPTEASSYLRRHFSRLCPDGCGLDCAHIPGMQEAGYTCSFSLCGSRYAVQRTFMTHLNTAHTHFMAPQDVRDCLDVKRMGQCPLCRTYTVLTLQHKLRSHKCSLTRQPASCVARRRVPAP